MPKAADELFDDFLYNFAANRKLQMERIAFPLKKVNGNKVETIDKRQWRMERYFMRQQYYTLLFDSERHMEVVKDTSVNHAVVEMIYFNTGAIIQHVFNRLRGVWMLTEIQTIPISASNNASFLEFYSRFSTDTEFQEESLAESIQFEGPDPDDDFARMEGVITPDTWEAFAPELPKRMIYNIIYGQPRPEGNRKVFVLRGIANGMELEMTFHRKGGEWRLTKSQPNIHHSHEDIRNYSLKRHNTFGIDARCDRFLEYANADEALQVAAILRQSAQPFIIIGGGSNLLLTRDFEGIVVRSAIKGIEVTADGNDVLLTCGSGEVWDDVVAFAVGQGFYGAENLSLIPGEVGASAVQNIGAYGAEAKDLIREVRPSRLPRASRLTFANADCQYGYRQSRFKHEWKNRFLITHVVYEFSDRFLPHLDYGNIRAELERRGIPQPTAGQLRQVIIDIRRPSCPTRRCRAMPAASS